MHSLKLCRLKWLGLPSSNFLKTTVKLYVGCQGLHAQVLVCADLPDGGLAAASTEVRDLSMVVMPALAMEMVCCSMACRQRFCCVSRSQQDKSHSLSPRMQMQYRIKGIWSSACCMYCSVLCSGTSEKNGGSRLRTGCA